MVMTSITLHVHSKCFARFCAQMDNLIIKHIQPGEHLGPSQGSLASHKIQSDLLGSCHRLAGSVLREGASGSPQCLTLQALVYRVLLSELYFRGEGQATYTYTLTPTHRS